MDGTFTKDIFNLTILMVASVDAANHAASISWAIVESVNENAWRFVPPSLLHLLNPSQVFLIQSSHYNPTSQSPIYNDYE